MGFQEAVRFGEVNETGAEHDQDGVANKSGNPEETAGGPNNYPTTPTSFGNDSGADRGSWHATRMSGETWKTANLANPATLGPTRDTL